MDIFIAKPEVAQPPATAFRYVDPGSSGGLADLAAKATYTLQVHGIEPFSSLFVNWAFLGGSGGSDDDDDDGKPKVRIKVLDSEGKKLTESKDFKSIDRPAILGVSLQGGETYTVEFENKGKMSVQSRDFSSKGGHDKTWILLKSAGKQYLVTARAGDVLLRAHLRQIPGPGLQGQTVVVESWQGLYPSQTKTWTA